jgi:hypothetical protein
MHLLATLRNDCHLEAIRQPWPKDLQVNTAEDASSLAILCSGHLFIPLVAGQVAILHHAVGSDE